MINEVVYDPPGNDAGCYIEILGPPNLNLTGYSLKFYKATGAEYIAPGLALDAYTIGANGFFVVVQDATVVVAAGASSTTSTKADMLNGPDSVQLVHIVGGVPTVIDALGYGNFPMGSMFLGEGTAATLPANSLKSLSRLPNGSDTNDNSVDFKAGTHTPGAANL